MPPTLVTKSNMHSDSPIHHHPLAAWEGHPGLAWLSIPCPSSSSQQSLHPCSLWNALSDRYPAWLMTLQEGKRWLQSSLLLSVLPMKRESPFVLSLTDCPYCKSRWSYVSSSPRKQNACEWAAGNNLTRGSGRHWHTSWKDSASDADLTSVSIIKQCYE